jgi:hypothetical protein
MIARLVKRLGGSPKPLDERNVPFFFGRRPYPIADPVEPLRECILISPNG